MQSQHDLKTKSYPIPLQPLSKINTAHPTKLQNRLKSTKNTPYGPSSPSTTPDSYPPSIPNFLPDIPLILIALFGIYVSIVQQLLNWTVSAQNPTFRT